MRERRCDQTGVYNAGEKMSLLMEISVYEDIPFCWKEIEVGESTTLLRFITLLNELFLTLQIISLDAFIVSPGIS